MPGPAPVGLRYVGQEADYAAACKEWVAAGEGAACEAAEGDGLTDAKR